MAPVLATANGRFGPSPVQGRQVRRYKITHERRLIIDPCADRDVPFSQGTLCGIGSAAGYGIGSAAGAAACRFLTIVVRVAPVGCSVPWGEGEKCGSKEFLRCPD